LAGYTDLPYRRSLRRHKCYYMFTEMVDTGALIYAKKIVRNYLERGDDEEWLGVQLVGSKVDEIDKALDIINTHEFSVLDLNIGCPTPKVVKKGKGAGLAKDIENAVQIVDLMVKKSRFPVTVKIRIQDEVDPEPTIKMAKKLESAGAIAITIHGRIMEKIYSGECYSEIIKAVKENVNVQVVANGGVMGKDSYLKLKSESGCSEIMVARGAMGNPWIFEEISSTKNKFPTTEELCAEINNHIFDVVDHYGEKLAMKISRKIVLDYIGGRGYSGELKRNVSTLGSIDEFKHFINELEKGPSKRYIDWISNNEIYK